MRRRMLVAVLAAALVLSGCGSSDDSPKTNSSDSLDVLSWWTSESEAAALQTYFDAFSGQYPSVVVINGAVAGGSGSNVQVLLSQRLRTSNPPDVWQTFAGAALKSYAEQGKTADLTGVYQKSGLTATLPAAVLDAVTMDGKQWGIPSGAHRENMLWFNKALLAQSGIAEPTSDYTTVDLIRDLGALKQSGITPLCLGGRDSFTRAELFETILLSNIGQEGWKAIIADKFDWSGVQATGALTEFGAVLDFADPDAPDLTWDEATKRLADGQCAFQVINDSSYGELVKDQAKEGTDFGYLPYPGTSDSFLAVIDTFVVARQAPNGQNALDFVATVASPEASLEFNKIKGSVPLRSDVEVGTLSAYQQESSAALTESSLLLSIVHGEAMSPAFQQGFYNAVLAYSQSRDASKFVSALQTATGYVVPPP